jgi:hypothetical protein
MPERAQPKIFPARHDRAEVGMQPIGGSGGYLPGVAAEARRIVRVAHARSSVMRHESLRAGAFVLAFLGGIGLAPAAAPAACRRSSVSSRKGAADPSGKAGKEEPSSHAPTEKPLQDAVLVNGALAVPGAPTDTDTVPAKFSEKNAADDKLITAAYTFKMLTDEQRRAIYQALKDRPAGSAFNAEVGAVLPPSVELNAMPDEVARRVPQTQGYRYAVADNRVLLVSPTGIVVGVLPDAKGVEAGEGRRTVRWKVPIVAAAKFV